MNHEELAAYWGDPVKRAASFAAIHAAQKKRRADIIKELLNVMRFNGGCRDMAQAAEKICDALECGDIPHVSVD